MIMWRFENSDIVLIFNAVIQIFAIFRVLIVINSSNVKVKINFLCPFYQNSLKKIALFASLLNCRQAP